MAQPKTISRKQEFAQFVVELMVDFAPVQAKPMFGGFGVYWQGLMFGLIAQDQLYLKADDQSVTDFTQRGLTPFTFESKGKVGTLRYYLAPAEVYDEPAHMAVWARKAYDCAVRQQKPIAKSRARSKSVETAPTVQEPMADLLTLKNLGQKSKEMLARAGIRSDAELRQLGSVVAFAKTKAIWPGASLNLLWALEGALTDRPWQQVAELDRASLLMALEDVQRHMG